MDINIYIAGSSSFISLYIHDICPFQMLGSSTTPLQDDHDEKFGVPSLEELGFDCESLKPPVWHGGEMEALSRLERHLERKAWVASFGLPKMTPQVTR